jgi:hypothetical protein
MNRAILAVCGLVAGGGLGMAGCVGAAAEPPASLETAEVAEARALTPADFEEWVGAQCPEDSLVVLADPGTGKVVHSMSCEDVRRKALADPSARASLVQAYQAKVEPAERGEGERTEATSEALTPIGGLACALVALGPGLIFGWPGRGCEHAGNPRDRRACEATTGGFSAGAGIFCAIAAFF